MARSEYWGHTNQMKEALEGLDKTNIYDLAIVGKKVRDLVLSAGIPDDLWKEIQEAYDKLCRIYGPDTDVAVRSSATAEDLPTASFAGQQESYLNIRGYHALREICSKCFAALFTDRGISYRIDKKYNHFEVGLSIGVMKMVRSDLASSGVIFTLDTETGFKDVIFITGSYGLGENIVQGAVNPDEFYVFKQTARTGHKAITRKNLGDKKIKMIYGQGTSKVLTRNVDVPESESRRFCITDDEILILAEYAIKIEDHYSGKAHQPVPMDIEWAKDGITGELFIVQARPETVHSQEEKDVLLTYHLEQRGQVIAKGRSVGEKIAAGKARIITDVSHLSEFQPGEILITDTTNPDWEPVMKTATAIVTNRGGRTCHAAIVSRELGLAAVVGTNDATEKIRTGQDVTVNCSEGDEGVVYDGILPFHVDSESLKNLTRPKTKIMMNLGNPDEAFAFSMIPNNILLIDEFSRLFDGFSIGSNDLTQLTLGIDRDSGVIAHEFDERDPGVMKFISMAIQGAHRNGRHSGICGEAPSDYPEFAEFLVREGIDSISLNPDSLMKITRTVVEMETRLDKQRAK